MWPQGQHDVTWNNNSGIDVLLLNPASLAKFTAIQISSCNKINGVSAGHKKQGKREREREREEFVSHNELVKPDY